MKQIACVCALVGSQLLAAVNAETTGVGAKEAVPIVATVLVKKNRSGRQFLSYEIQNVSNVIYCVAQSLLDADSGGLWITAESGDQIPRGMPVERERAEEHGLDFQEAYVFLRPSHSYIQDLPVSAYAPRAGLYRFHIALRVFDCADIVAVVSKGLARDIRSVDILQDGTFSVGEVGLN